MNETNTVKQVETIHQIEREIIESAKRFARTYPHINSESCLLGKKLIRAEAKLAEMQKV